MKYLEDTNVILDIKLLKEDNGGFTILQSHYEEKVLSSFGLVTTKLLLHLMILVCY